jgi:hypothetical protein
MAEIFRNRIAKLRVWWRTPASRKERIYSTLLGAFAGFWIGTLLGAWYIGFPVLVSVVIWYGVVGALSVASLGALFPKVVGCIALPFAFMGGGAGT